MDAFETLYRKSSGKVYRYLLSLTGSQERAEELTAETFYRAYLHIDRFQGRSSVDTWLFSIAKNVWRTEQRRAGRLADLPEDRPEEGDPFWTKLEDHDSAMEIHLALHRLPEPFREVFTLRVFGELKFADIGAIFGKSESWAKMTFYRGKDKLLTLLNEEESS
ncbi:MAG: RNA polymerase sigma factor [Clostridiales bacterium]|nr:RNA polymerase sigma factor [Clostridiales bacterium]